RPVGPCSSASTANCRCAKPNLGGAAGGAGRECRVMTTPLRVDVLGPLRVRDTAGRDLTPTGGLQRRLLALLVLCRGRVVGTDVAVGALWSGELPHDLIAALQNHVARLRR